MIDQFKRGGRYSNGDNRQYFSKSGIETEAVRFLFGKYMGSKVAEITDLGYLNWFKKNVEGFEDIKLAVEDRIFALSREAESGG